jgi:probable HAF family extracellular repeat protein
MSMSKLVITVLTTAGALCIRAQTYTITELIADDVESIGYAINNSGQVAGSTVAQEPGAVVYHPFLWDPTTGKHELGSLPGYNGGAAYGINELGHVVGCSWICDKRGCGVEARAFLYRDGFMIDLNAGYYSCANAVNSADQVAGDSNSGAFLWNSGVVTIIVPDGSQSNYFSGSEARGINEAGQVAGTWWETVPSPECNKSPFPPCHFIDIVHSFRWASGSSQTLGQSDASAYAINSAGAVAGNFRMNNRNHAFLWSVFSTFVEIAPLDGHNSNSALGINSSGDVVGASNACEESRCADPRAFLYRDGVVIDLNDRIDQSGWQLLSANAINDRGQIAVTGRKDGESFSKVLLLTPIESVPER